MNSVSEMIAQMGQMRGPNVTAIRVWSDVPPAELYRVGTEIHMHPAVWDAIKRQTENATRRPFTLDFHGTMMGIPVVFGAPPEEQAWTTNCSNE